VAITIYFRRKTDRGWRYEALGIGRRPEAARTGPYYSVSEPDVDFRLSHQAIHG
jgi:hypothetical protein